MIKTLASKIGEFKKETLLAPLFMIGEVLMECLIPAVKALLIDEMTGESLTPVIKYGIILIGLAFVSFFCGQQSAKKAATASTGFAISSRFATLTKTTGSGARSVPESARRTTKARRFSPTRTRTTAVFSNATISTSLRSLPRTTGTSRSPSKRSRRASTSSARSRSR